MLLSSKLPLIPPQTSELKLALDGTNALTPSQVLVWHFACYLKSCLSTPFCILVDQFNFKPPAFMKSICAFARSYYSCDIGIPDQKSEDRAGCGAKQPDYDVRHDESAGSCDGKTSRHGAPGGNKKMLGVIILKCSERKSFPIRLLPLTDLVLYTFRVASAPSTPPRNPHIFCLIVSLAVIQSL